MKKKTVRYYPDPPVTRATLRDWAKYVRRIEYDLQDGKPVIAKLRQLGAELEDRAEQEAGRLL